GYDSAALTKECEHTSRREAIDAAEVGRRADGVVDHLKLRAPGESQYLGDEVLRGVVDDLVRARIASQARLLGGGHGTEDGRVAAFRDLAEQQPDAASSGVYEAAVAGLERMDRRGEVVRRHSLEHHGRRSARVEAVRDRH